MPKNDTIPVSEAVKNLISELVREEVTSITENVVNMVKMNQKMTNTTLESLTSAMNLMEKQFNMKIGGIKGNVIKKQREDDVLATFDSFDDLQAYIELQRKRVPSVDKESEQVDLSTGQILPNVS